MARHTQHMRVTARPVAIEPVPYAQLAAMGLPPGATRLTMSWKVESEGAAGPETVDSGVTRLVFPVESMRVDYTMELTTPPSRPPRPAQAEAEALLDYLARHLFDLRWVPAVTLDGGRAHVSALDVRLCEEHERAGVHDVEGFLAQLRRLVAEELRQ